MSVLDAIAAGCLLLGSLLALSAGIGLVRFRTTLERMHAGTKPQVLGVLLVLLALWLHRPSPAYVGPLLLVALSQVITVSVAAYMVARAANARQSSRDGTGLPSQD